MTEYPGGTSGEPSKELAFAGGKWHPEVKASLENLEKKKKLKEVGIQR